MGLHYTIQNPMILIGTKTAANVVTGVALTSSYQAEGAGAPTKTFDTSLCPRVEFLIKYTEGATESANSIQIKIEATNDKVNFFQLATDSTSGGTSTSAQREWTYVGADAAASNYNFGLDIAYLAMRISVKETGVASNAGNVYVEALLSGR